MKVLHVAAEVFPLVKTGGLADVVAALPAALAAQGLDVRLLLPGYPAVLESVQAQRVVGEVGPCFGALRVRLLLGRMPFSGLPVYVLDAPYMYRRPGNPYNEPGGDPWPDNAQRFALLGWVAAHLAEGDADEDWAPDVVHAHDWHAAMTCTYMADHAATRAVSVFTVHNLAYQGLFPMQDAPLLGLASRWMSPGGIEYHGQLSFMKAGLNFADRVTTVSPTYAREMAMAEFGCGLDGVIRSRGGHVTGILNGIDEGHWNPAADAALAQRYDVASPQGKRACRRALQAELGLDVDDDALLMVVVSRLTSQKGLDLVLASVQALVHAGVQIAVQGEGDRGLEAAFRLVQDAHPGRVQVFIGYDEARAHRLIAGGDVIAVPSRFEPCGLTQLYGLRYGTLPVVRRVGGLADTVLDAADVGEDGATGFVFDAAEPWAFEACVRRALQARRQPSTWAAMMRRAMAQSLSWDGPARAYRELYGQALAVPG